MKILYAPLQNPSEIQLGTIRALMEVGTVEVINYRAWRRHLDGVTPAKLLRAGQARQALRRWCSTKLSRALFRLAARNASPDVVHMQIQQDDLIVPGLLRKLREDTPKAKLSHWTGDRRAQVPRNLLACALECDFTLSSSYTYVEMFREHGCNAYYLQHSYEPMEHVSHAAAKDIPVVFLGNYVPHKSFPGTQERLEIAEAIKRFGGRVHGKGWPSDISRSEINKFCGAGSVYSRAKIAININHFHKDLMYQSDRWFHAAASGAFTLSYRSPGIEYIMEDGKHTRCFSSVEELSELIEYYLAHEDERELIARQGREHCIRYHSRGVRARELLRIWNCPVPGVEHWVSPILGEVEAELVRSLARGRILDMGACLRTTGLANDPMYTNVDGNLSEAKWHDSIMKVPFHGGIFDTVSLHFVNSPHWALALEEARRLAVRNIIVFAAPPELSICDFGCSREHAHLIATRARP
jgi:Glycosyl transferases group 1